ncbi:uncharacterized protein VTP21DRAFT_852 [Calcarisporiella thermophila]|uniref:uncharacterized protein n=1 Tax=Calcarisporiella thermophila TaxID=911321 RepID=UPI0037448D13
MPVQMSSASVSLLPYVSVQSDWESVVDDVASGKTRTDSFWVSCYRKGTPSVHGSVQVYKNQSEPIYVEMEGENSIQVQRIHDKSFRISCPSFEIENVTISAPAASFKNEKNPYTSLDISPGGELFVVGGDNGNLKIGDTSTGDIRRELRGHVGDITTCRFFPSGQVILSGATDFQLKIWSVLDGSCPVTLKGHKMGVLDTAIIVRGRNVLSSSRDGTIRLWECASADTIRTMGNYSCPVNKIALGIRMEGSASQDNYNLDTREVETQDKLVVAALDDGSLRGIDLASKDEIFNLNASQLSVPLISCSYASELNLIATGSAEGIITVYDVRNLNSALLTFQRSEFPIYDIHFMDEDGFPSLLVAEGGGSAFRTSSLLDASNLRSVQEFTGFDMDPVMGVRVHSYDRRRVVYLAGRDKYDGCVRKYDIIA